MRRERTAFFFAFLFVALALGPSAAHLLELPNKIDLPRDAYFTVQAIYRGWALLGIVVAGALLSTLFLTVVVWKRTPARYGALVAFLCIVATQVIFWTFTYPANQATENWTVVPEDWRSLRLDWEYSHAVAAVVNLAAYIALVAAALARIAEAHPQDVADRSSPLIS